MYEENFSTFILYTTQYIESFFCGYSELAFRHPSMITGWYGALSNTDEKKVARLTTASQHFTEKYGTVGSPNREEFEAKAQAWYYAELLRDE